MLTHLLLPLVGVLAAASDPPRPAPFHCGTNTAHASEDFLKTISELHSKPSSGSPAARAALIARDDSSPIVASSAKKSSITNNMPSAQIDALNTAYKPYSISFNLINVTWTTNDDAMKKSLRQGTYKTLNLYFQTDLSGGILGRCSPPSNIATNQPDHTVYFNDGCNVNANTHARW